MNNEKPYFAYEENPNPLSIAVVIFQTHIRSENPETSIKKENGQKRCFPQRKGNQESSELFLRADSSENKGNRYFKPGDELKKNRPEGRFFL